MPGIAPLSVFTFSFSDSLWAGQDETELLPKTTSPQALTCATDFNSIAA
jgi:hypothetical protein